jgi:hypothetical protein
MTTPYYWHYGSTLSEYLIITGYPFLHRYSVPWYYAFLFKFLNPSTGPGASILLVFLLSI